MLDQVQRWWLLVLPQTGIKRSAPAQIGNRLATPSGRPDARKNNKLTILSLDKLDEMRREIEPELRERLGELVAVNGSAPITIEMPEHLKIDQEKIRRVKVRGERRKGYLPIVPLASP